MAPMQALVHSQECLLSMIQSETPNLHWPALNLEVRIMVICAYLTKDRKLFSVFVKV